MATYQEQTGKSIDEAFEKFHRDNPHVYRKFKQLVSEAIIRGKTKMSAKTILGKIRWDIFMETQSDDEYKINDAFTSRYARKYIEDCPGNEHIFELRSIDRTRIAVASGSGQLTMVI